jgi:hypothetical protein
MRRDKTETKTIFRTFGMVFVNVKNMKAGSEIPKLDPDHKPTDDKLTL